MGAAVKAFPKGRAICCDAAVRVHMLPSLFALLVNEICAFWPVPTPAGVFTDSSEWPLDVGVVVKCQIVPSICCLDFPPDFPEFPIG